MKRMILLSLALPFLWLQTARAQAPLTTPFYPLNVGDKWTYRVVDLKAPLVKADPKKTVVVEVERPEIYARKNVDKNGKATIDEKVGFILKSTSGSKTTRDHVVVLEDGVYRVHAAGTPMTPPLPFFKLGLKKPGETWECNSVSGNITIKGTFTWSYERVKVLDKGYDAFHISFTNGKGGDDRVEVDCWFAEKVGMVKQRHLEKGREIALELQSFEKAKQ
jgi:hypothetical protein